MDSNTRFVKGNMDRAGFCRLWLSGAEMLLRTGTTTVCDVEAILR